MSRNSKTSLLSTPLAILLTCAYGLGSQVGEAELKDPGPPVSFHLDEYASPPSQV